MSHTQDLKNKRLELFNNIDIYPVISSEFTNGRSPVTVLENIAAGGARIVQLREKALSKKALYELALLYREITQQHNMLLIINDHIDIALAVGADGVHLGQDDLPVECGRKLTPDLIIGSSSHNLQEALDAQQQGADYVNIGPIYPTKTKSVACGVVGLEMISNIEPHLQIPFTVMGGIKEHHLDGLLEFGATKIAMVTEITQACDVTQKVMTLRSHWHSK